MSRRMSCSLTIDQVRAHTKTVTRRHVDTWKHLKAGDRLTLIEKGMGLKEGEKQVVLADVEIIDVRVEPLRFVCSRGELAAEGFPDIAAWAFIQWWCKSHGYGEVDPQIGSYIKCRRIEWRYLQ